MGKHSKPDNDPEYAEDLSYEGRHELKEPILLDAVLTLVK